MSGQRPKPTARPAGRWEAPVDCCIHLPRSSPRRPLLRCGGGRQSRGPWNPIAPPATSIMKDGFGKRFKEKQLISEGLLE